MAAKETAIATAVVGVVMGSKTDYEHMVGACEVMTELRIAHEVRILSAHRSPDQTIEYAATAEERGLKVIIAGAGGAAHLPGIIAAKTLIPVIGVPMPTAALHGIDSLLSMVQMPKGVPVATMAIGKSGASNAGLLAAAIIAVGDREVASRLAKWRAALTRELLQQKLP
jgi:5-(carboxyamino)imidazole ribonucleotide mutase